ncbi:SDR family oxidoreductase [Streptomyces californicus]|uniref:SDR family NAD(P)-dependent oxidoreductase n=1 Tax=Streptomyces californicus TaxID=67351 RepID=UPI00296F8FE1|nr:SDR family oxidoreductase [Streptomyces californicus]MDW4901401.1 SDR family oxidoreductase [Streptomyces californicus]
MKTGLTDKVVLVTGASRGIGRATALAYAAEGARVAITYHSDEAGAKETAERVAAAGGTPHVVRYDLGDEDSVRSAVASVGAEWGGVDVLVAGAVEWGEAIPRPGRKMPAFEEVPPAQWQRVLRTSVDGVFHTVQAVLPLMRDREWGRIVVLGAGLAETGLPGAAAYGAAKAALHGLVRSLAREVGPAGILVNEVVPGQTLTENVLAHASPAFLENKAASLPSGRMNTPEDVARAIVFLGSAANGNIHGEALRVTGGL